LKTLIDNCLPIDLRQEITGHDVETARHRGWTALENGAVVEAAVEAGFEVIVSIDQGHDFARAVEGKPIAAILLPGAQGSRLEGVRSLVPAALVAIPDAAQGVVTRI
jgi:predicted nuclease of predicted toxin-antitoxin system